MMERRRSSFTDFAVQKDVKKDLHKDQHTGTVEYTSHSDVEADHKPPAT